MHVNIVLTLAAFAVGVSCDSGHDWRPPSALDSEDILRMYHLPYGHRTDQLSQDAAHVPC